MQELIVDGLLFISPTWRIRKEKLAHEQQEKEYISTGLIGVWSCLEQGSSYRAVYCAEAGFPQLRPYQVQCKHLGILHFSMKVVNTFYSIIKFFEYRRPQRLPVRNENDGGLFPCQAKNRRPAATGPQT
ncbi:MAG: hypothetical protein U9P10_04875, partial [Thermodesulfobacteriota bacterium]|nr:hypothetical protein [Thermodesulfobacteriota bacterium]